MHCHIIIHSAISPQTARLLIIQHPETGLGLQHCSLIPSRWIMVYWFMVPCRVYVQPTWSVLGDARCLHLMADGLLVLMRHLFLVCPNIFVWSIAPWSPVNFKRMIFFTFLDITEKQSSSLFIDAVFESVF